MIIIPYVMKRLTTLFTLITMSVIMNAQTRGDFFAFVDSFNWKLSKEQFEEKYASRILPKTDSLVASMSFDCPYYVLDDLSIGEYDCYTIIYFEDESSSPYIVSLITPNIEQQHMQSVFSARLDKIANEKMGIPDESIDGADTSQLGFDLLAGAKVDVKAWVNDKFCMLSLKAYTESGLLYLFCAQESEKILMTLLMTGKDPIQDTFFGLKMKDKITSTQIKNAIGARGVFIEETRESNSINYYFKDMYFAGSKWDYAIIVCTSDGKFYQFYASASNSYDQYKDARYLRNLYDILKSKLDDKYNHGEEEKNEDGSIQTTYLGSNDMAIMLSYEISNSFNTSVNISYINVSLFNNQISANDDEL